MQPMTDTSPEIAEMVRARLMALSGAERFRMGVQMFDAARRMVLASLPHGLSETERKRFLFERLYGEPLPVQPGHKMKIAEDVRNYAGEQGAPEEEELKKGDGKKSKEFVEKGAEVCAKA
jgi:hypothetical protein